MNRIPSRLVSIKRCTSKYDGPLDGVCSYNGLDHFFVCKEFGGWENESSILPGTLYYSYALKDQDTGENIFCVKRIYELYKLTYLENIILNIQNKILQFYIDRYRKLSPTFSRLLRTLMSPAWLTTRLKKRQPLGWFACGDEEEIIR